MGRPFGDFIECIDEPRNLTTSVEPTYCDDPRTHPAREHVAMCGCLIVGLLVVLLFVLVPLPLWPLLVVGLVVLVALAAALGFLRGLIGVIFRR
jgi:hypothetical protein